MYLNVVFTHKIFIRYLSVWRTCLFVIGRFVDFEIGSCVVFVFWFLFFLMAQQPVLAQDLLIIEAS